MSRKDFGGKPPAQSYVAVVGAVNLDIWGQSEKGIILHDSNPGAIRFSVGGVGRNIAHNLALLGVQVEMLTALGGDIWAAAVEKSCTESGIGLREAIRIPDGRTSGYLYVSGPDGEMTLGICDAEIVENVSPDVILQKLDFLNLADIVVMDGNLSAETIECIAKHCTSPLFADPVSTTKAEKMRAVLPHIHTFKPNTLEAEALTGQSDPEKAARELVRRGVKRVFVSDGENGVFAAEGTDCIHIPCCKTQLVNCTGGGDAVMAALCKSYLDGRDTEAAARYAMAAGAIAVESAETISQEMNEKNVLSRIDWTPILLRRYHNGNS